MEELQHDKRPLRAHLAPLAKRGNPDALALLRPPEFPRTFAYLFDWYGEFCLWHDHQRQPEWRDWQAWAGMMQRAVTPFDLRMLRRIHAAYSAIQQRSAAHG